MPGRFRILRSTVLSLTLLLAGGTAFGQSPTPDPEAMAAFKDLVESYRQRDALNVRTTVRISAAQGEAHAEGSEVEAEVTWRRDGTGRVELRGYTVHLRDGKVHAVHEKTDHSYFSVGDDDSPYYALMNLFVDIPFPHLAIAFGEPEVDEFFCMQFHPKAPFARPTAVTDAPNDDGVMRRRIDLTSDFENLQVVVDPETNLIESVKLTLTGGPFVQDGTTMLYKHRFEYDTFTDEPLDDTVLAFDPGKRQRVDMLTTLLPAAEPAEVDMPAMRGGGGLAGQPAPPLVLATSDGNAIDLEELRGQVVVLDFWATWCMPCRRALPLLHDLSRWAADEQLPVKVITVNVFERDRAGDGTPDTRLKNVQKYWADSNFTLPVAMDYTDDVAAAYGVRSIPSTVVIRSDGVVHTQHSGMSPTYLQTLKADIRAALAALEAGDEGEQTP